MTDQDWQRIAERLRGQLELEQEHQRTPVARPELLERDDNGYWPADNRLISSGPGGIAYRTTFAIEYVNGEYWEVRYTANEWSSNYGQVGRGRTLPEAWAAFEADAQ